jgi:signal transduction histidine kinase
MGMAIVHSLVTQHGGLIDVTSRPDGTAVTVSLPRRQSRHR